MYLIEVWRIDKQKIRFKQQRTHTQEEKYPEATYIIQMCVSYDDFNPSLCIICIKQYMVGAESWWLHAMNFFQCHLFERISFFNTAYPAIFGCGMLCVNSVLMSVSVGLEWESICEVFLWLAECVL